MTEKKMPDSLYLRLSFSIDGMIKNITVFLVDSFEFEYCTTIRSNDLGLVVIV